MQKRLGWRFNQRLNVPDWREHRFDGLRYARKVLVTRPQNFVSYYPMWEGNGAISFDNSPEGNDAVYTGVTLAQLGIGDGRYSAFFDGANDYNSFHSAGWLARFNGDELSVTAWARMNDVSVWTDGLQHKIIQIHVDGNNFMTLSKEITNGRLRWRYKAGGVDKIVDENGVTETDWMNIGITASLSLNEMRAFRDGVQVGAIQVGLGGWVGAPNPTFSQIGANSNVPTTVWLGLLQHIPTWNAALIPSEMAFLAER